MHDSRAKNTFGRELQSFRRRQMHHSHWSSWELCSKFSMLLGEFFAAAGVPIPLEYCNPNNMRNRRYQNDELLILPWMLVWLLLWAALCSLVWPGFVLSSALPVPCLTWAALPACLRASFRSLRSALCSAKPCAKLLCKGRSMGSEYPGNGKVFLGWSHVLEIKGEYQTFLCCSPCHCVMSLKGFGLAGQSDRLMDRLLPCLQETAQIVLLLPETQWCLMPFLV